MQIKFTVGTRDGYDFNNSFYNSFTKRLYSPKPKYFSFTQINIVLFYMVIVYT